MSNRGRARFDVMTFEYSQGSPRTGHEEDSEAF